VKKPADDASEWSGTPATRCIAALGMWDSAEWQERIEVVLTDEQARLRPSRETS
jgi:hypothetical protein